MNGSVGTTLPRMNGPEGDAEFWNSIDWSQEEGAVRRLRQRIYRASKEGNLKQVRNLQKLMLRSRANTLTSVRRVAQHSTGKKTAGIDGRVALTPSDRGRLARQIHAEGSPQAKPVRRVYIPKANGKTRPLGIPIISDRANQARVKNALEPEWEAKFEGRSYGFRPGRGCQDAAQAIFNVAKDRGAKRVWVLDADLSAAFDRISHSHLMDAIGAFPARQEIQRWLRAGVMDQGRFTPTEEGTPQGGVISPLLLNVALHGMGEAIGANVPSQKDRKDRSPALIRYADDFVVMCHNESMARKSAETLAAWLEPRGLAINWDKTRIVRLGDGFDFLGFNIRRIRQKLIITPSRSAVRRVKEGLRI